MINHQDYIQAFSHFLQSGDDSKLSQFLASDESTSFLKIYRNGFYKACLSALQANFASLTLLLGEQKFDQIATQYIRQFPPRQSTLVAYGMVENAQAKSEKVGGIEADKLNQTVGFTEFFQQAMVHFELESLDKTINQTSLLDIALLDQAWISTLNQKNDNLVSLEQVQDFLAKGEDLTQLPFKLADSVSFVCLEYDIFLYWQNLKFNGQKGEANFSEKQEVILFWQYEDSVQAKSLSSTEWHFYRTFFESGSMEDALNAASQWDESFDISALFADLLNASLLKLEAQT
ncbi:hypothetical protein MED121_22447 [Marinomonas sp. MED121]|uniref:HvfC/BufC N-terminal domain-containing protein n=1 Tax=Marinomonas sp. MED121 TaxID=314277 RepID=UPI000068FDB0|nr:DNA-binding domain-containing protein [Marinomonas sp. MED121]EAQ65479.1 hypothetical protein MED121_22447 [Marinomonas sp. MED121]